jgi:protein-tyrosine phosphatase
MIDYLNENINNVVFVHCNAGKGRTGTLICSFFMFVQFMENTEDARHYYSWKRFTTVKRGVT